MTVADCTADDAVGPKAPRSMRREGVVYGLSSVVPIATALAITPLVTRALGPDEYGQLAARLVVVQVLTAAACLGLPGAVTRHAIMSASGVPGAARLVLWCAAVGAGVALVGAATAPWWAEAATGDPVDAATLVAVVAGCAQAGCSAYQSLLRGQHRPWAFVAVAVLCSPVAQGAGLLLALTGRDAVSALRGMAAVYLVVLAGSLAACVPLARKAARTERDLRDALRIGAPTMPHVLATMLATTLPVTAASHVAAPQEVGRFQLLFFMGTIPALAVGAVNNAWAPAVYSADSSARAELVSRTAPQFGMLGWLLSLVCCLGAPLGLAYFAGANATQGAPWAVTAAASAAGAAMVAYLSQVHMMFAEGRTLPLAWVTPLNVAIAGATGIGLNRWLGLPGLAAIPTVFYGLQAATTATLARRRGGDVVRMSQSLLIAFITLVCALAVAQLPSDQMWGLMRVGCAAVLCALGAVLWKRRSSA